MKALVWILCCLVAGTAIGLINANQVPLAFLWTLIIGGGAISYSVSLCYYIDERREEKKKREEEERQAQIHRRPPPSPHK